MEQATDGAPAKAASLAELSADPERNQRLRLRVGPIHGDFSRQCIDLHGLDCMLALAASVDLDGMRAALAGGAVLNNTEQRAAMHHLLRADAAGPAASAAMAAAKSDIAASLEMIRRSVRQLREQGFADGQRVVDIINVGIGGSDLGPRLLDDALGAAGGPRLHFVSSVDAHRAADLIAKLDPSTTAVVLVSKSFATEETLLNGRLFLHWLQQSLGAQAASTRVFAVTANVRAAQQFGVDAGRCFAIWDWVGGRYSLWSAVGFSFVLAHGFEVFERLLAGARMMDEHFFEAPFACNLPVLRGLIEHWNRSKLDLRSRCVVPYDVRLTFLSSYLQQLEMESNGKSVQRGGAPVENPTAPIVWGGAGTDAQHAFFQALHQGTNVVPVEFIGVINPAHAHAENHRVLLANLLAQSAALAYGHDTSGSDDTLAAHRRYPGNRPSTVLLLDALTPESLGALIAMYEHSVFVEACLVGINPFDQWGVELGKRIAREVLPALSSDAAAAQLDPVTQALISEIRSR